jgi:hypothetical protein
LRSFCGLVFNQAFFILESIFHDNQGKP